MAFLRLPLLLLGTALLCVAAGPCATAAGAAPTAAAARTPTTAKPAAKPRPLTGYAMDALWEVDVQNLTCQEINRLRYLQTTRNQSHPTMAGVISDILSDPQHDRDTQADVFGPILVAWAHTAELPSIAQPDNPDAIRPGELKMLTYLDIAARERNCAN